MRLGRMTIPKLIIGLCMEEGQGSVA